MCHNAPSDQGRHSHTGECDLNSDSSVIHAGLDDASVAQIVEYAVRVSVSHTSDHD